MNNLFCSSATVLNKYAINNLRRLSTGLWNFKQNRIFKQKNPGLDNRLSILTESSHDEIEMEDLETDFTNAGNMYTSHMSERKSSKEMQKLNIVKRKYFKPTHEPNFLSWAEKEQIRHLHRSDPAEWTTEKLSQSFPASEMVIKKIIKSQWKPENDKKVTAHDNSVERNWSALERNKFQIDDCNRNHILKFAKRVHVSNANFEGQVPLKVIDSSSTNLKGDFLDIVKSYDNGNQDTNSELIAVPRKSIGNSVKTRFDKSSPRGDSYVLDDEVEHIVLKNSSLSTLEKYRETFHLSTSNNGSKTSTGLTPEKNNPVSEKSPEQLHLDHPNKTKINVNLIQSNKSDRKNSYDEHISIPKNKWKEGGTYRVGECYYDDDGEFLYRVPGMK